MLAKARRGRLGLQAGFELTLGVVHRSLSDRLRIPIEVGWQFRPKLVGRLQTGWFGPLDGFSDAVEIPVGLGLDYRWTRRFEVGGSFVFENFFGRGATFDRRALLLRFSFWLDLPKVR